MEMRSIEILADLRTQEIERGLQARSVVALLRRCRDMVLGILPVTRPCDACATC